MIYARVQQGGAGDAVLVEWSTSNERLTNRSIGQLSTLINPDQQIYSFADEHVYLEDPGGCGVVEGVESLPSEMNKASALFVSGGSVLYVVQSASCRDDASALEWRLLRYPAAGDVSEVADSLPGAAPRDIRIVEMEEGIVASFLTDGEAGVLWRTVSIGLDGSLAEVTPRCRTGESLSAQFPVVMVEHSAAVPIACDGELRIQTVGGPSTSGCSVHVTSGVDAESKDGLLLITTLTPQLTSRSLMLLRLPACSYVGSLQLGQGRGSFLLAKALGTVPHGTGAGSVQS